MVERGLEDNHREESKFELLRNVRLFGAFTDSEIKGIASIAVEARFKKGDVIYQRGAVGDSLYIIQAGVVTARDVHFGGSEEEIIAGWGAGDYFGELSLLTDQPRSATMTIESDEAVLLAVGREPFEHFMSENNRIIDELLRVMTRRVHELNTGQVVSEDKSMLIYLMRREALLAGAIVAAGYRIEEVLDENGKLTAIKLEKVGSADLNP